VASFAGFGSSGLEDAVSELLGGEPETEYPRLYRNRGDGTFEDVTRAAGLWRVLQAMGANHGDLDNDGFLDAYFGTGDPDFKTLIPNRMFRNDGGRRFQDVTTAGGFGNVQKGHGIAFGDMDNDGDQDVYAVLGGAYSGDVYPNALFLNPGNEHLWITLRLRGTSTNRMAIGARVRLVVVDQDGAKREIHRVVGTGGSFGSSSLQLEIGLGAAVAIERLEVLWPVTELRETFDEVPLDRVLKVVEGLGALEVVESTPIRFPTEASAEHGHHHR